MKKGSKAPLLSRVQSLEKKINTLYNRYYAREIRRQKNIALWWSQFENWRRTMKGFDRVSLARVGRFMRRIQSGKSLVYLSTREYHLLKLILQRKYVFAPRRKRS